MTFGAIKANIHYSIRVHTYSEAKIIETADESEKIDLFISSKT